MIKVDVKVKVDKYLKMDREYHKSYSTGGSTNAVSELL
jgi:hypothetical protein